MNTKAPTSLHRNGGYLVQVVIGDLAMALSLRAVLNLEGFRTQLLTENELLGQFRDQSDAMTVELSGASKMFRLRAAMDDAPRSAIVVIVSSQAEAAEAVLAGADEIIFRPIDIDEAVRTLAAVLRRSSPRGGRAARRGAEILSRQEREVVSRLMAGMTSKEIGVEMRLSHRTVDSYRRTASLKLGARNVPHLLRILLG